MKEVVGIFKHFDFYIDLGKASSTCCANLGFILDMIGSSLNWKVHDLTTTTNW